MRKADKALVAKLNNAMGHLREATWLMEEVSEAIVNFSKRRKGAKKLK